MKREAEKGKKLEGKGMRQKHRSFVKIWSSLFDSSFSLAVVEERHKGYGDRCTREFTTRFIFVF